MSAADSHTLQESEGAPAIAAIILAAGRSARMGKHKLLAPLAGRPLLAWTLAAACASDARPVLLTLGRDAPAVAAAMPAGPYTVVVNARYAEGMGGSLALAIGQLDQLAPAVSGALILLGDQPFMPSSAIAAILSAARAQPVRIVMGGHGARTGHPVYLPRRVFSELRALHDDEGARRVIARERGDAVVVPIADEYATFDVDTPEDYQRAQEIARSLSGGIG